MNLGRLTHTLAALCAAACLSGCNQSATGQAPIYLPQGDAVQGESHFVSLGCISCHSVVGADLAEPSEPGPVRVLLGSSLGMSYGQLVTSVVNPSHRLAARYRAEEVSADGESLMASYNDVMTVTQLVDIVAFLQPYYSKAERPGYKYPVYRYEVSED